MTDRQYVATDETTQERGRTLALLDAVQHIRRGASALLACRAGEGDDHRLAITFDAHQRLIAALAELESLR